MTNFQRKDAISNVHVGRKFEERTKVALLVKHDLNLDFNHKVAVRNCVTKKGARHSIWAQKIRKSS